MVVLRATGHVCHKGVLGGFLVNRVGGRENCVHGGALVERLEDIVEMALYFPSPRQMIEDRKIRTKNISVKNGADCSDSVYLEVLILEIVDDGYHGRVGERDVIGTRSNDFAIVFV